MHIRVSDLRRLALITLLLMFANAGSSGLVAQEFTFKTTDIGDSPFELSSTDNKSTVVCFLGTECPLAKLYASRLNELAAEFNQVRFVAIYSNQQDSVADIKAFRDRHRLAFPIIKDEKNVLADQFGAVRTPEVFFLDSSLKQVYRGRIDDQYQPGIAKAKPNRNDLRLAISQHLAGEPIEISKTEPEGCLIGRLKAKAGNNKVTYANQISRILQNHCSECHRAGEIGPMEFADYDEVVGWAEMIVEVVDDNRMPPWHADPKHGEFVNERRMTSAEKQMLRDWVADGAPRGDEKNLPPARTFAAQSEWRLPKDPDLIVPMRANPFIVPESGTVEYQYFVVDPGFKEDKWVTAAEIIPGDRGILHHSIVFVRPPDGVSFRGIGWLAAYVPGQSAPAHDPKFGRRIPAGSRFVFQQHYTPNGKQSEDITRIGLVFGDESKIENEIFTLIALDQEFVIPPGAEDFPVSAKFHRVPDEGSLLGVSPHMHYRGKSFELTAEIKDGPKNEAQPNSAREEIVLKVPDYDFNWQHIYQLKNPIPLSKIGALKFTAAFNNSSSNPANPDPTQHVTWGDQTWEEMAVAFAMVSVPRQPANQSEEQAEEQSQAELAAAKKRRAELKPRVDAFVEDYFSRFDKNKDDQIQRSELPRATRNFGMWQLDSDGDGVISRADIAQQAERRFLRER